MSLFAFIRNYLTVRIYVLNGAVYSRFACIETDSGVQLVALIVELNHRPVECIVIWPAPICRLPIGLPYSLLDH